MARGQAAVEMAKSPADFQDAIREFQKAIELAPNWPDPYYNLALLQEKTGRLKEAVASLKQYLRLAPNAPDAAKVQEQIYKLEYKAEQVLSIPEIIDVLVSFWPFKWQKEGEECRYGRDELFFEREGSDTIKVERANLYYPNRKTYQTLKVTGPVLKYITTINVCGEEFADRQPGGCDAVMEHEVELVSKRLLKVNQKVLRGGHGAGVGTGQRFSCTFQKE